MYACINTIYYFFLANLFLSLASTLVSFGAPGVPQNGLATMLVVLQTVGLPEDSIILIVAVDWFV